LIQQGTLKPISGLLQKPQRSLKMSSMSVFIIFLHGLFSSIGIIENLFILGIVGFHIRRSVIRIWIVNLAASDLLATASLPFFTIYMANGNTWTFGTHFCRIHSSVFFLLVLRPVWAQNHRNIHLVAKICGFIWALAIICTIPFYIFRDTIHRPDGKIMCYYSYTQYLPRETFNLESLCKQRQEALALMKFFLAFLMPLIVIIFSYVAVNVSLVHRGCRRPFHFVRLVVALVVSFVLCWAPYHFFIIIEVMVPTGHPAHTFAEKALPIAATIGFLNSVLNPILYVFSCPDLCSKIRHSLGAVMENVLVEDLAEMARCRNSARSSVSNNEISLNPRTVIPP
uniref:G-protein coupled receptors family 1 profile domain-containing protein n=1 Tax=Mola mola TaxID=94237 RepID=A0A3Q3X0L2_MOLML